MALDLTLFTESLLVIVFSTLGAFTRELFVHDEEKEGRWRAILITGIVSGSLIFLAYGVIIPKKVFGLQGIAFIGYIAGLIGFQVLLTILRRPSSVVKLGGTLLSPIADAMEKDEEEKEVAESEGKSD